MKLNYVGTILTDMEWKCLITTPHSLKKLNREGQDSALLYYISGGSINVLFHKSGEGSSIS